MSATDAPATRAFTLEGETATQALAAALAMECRDGDCLLLSGDLGSGKTTFARGFIRALCGDSEDIVSPTFTLAQHYDTKTGGVIWHFDLYRLKSSRELIEIGLEDALQQGITLIEWPQLAADMLPASALHIDIDYGDGMSRLFTLSGHARVWSPRLDALDAKDRS